MSAVNSEFNSICNDLLRKFRCHLISSFEKYFNKKKSGRPGKKVIAVNLETQSGLKFNSEVECAKHFHTFQSIICNHCMNNSKTKRNPAKKMKIFTDRFGDQYVFQFC